MPLAQDMSGFFDPGDSDVEVIPWSGGLSDAARAGCINPVHEQEDIPQGLKPAVLLVNCGTTEVVPFQGSFMQPVLGSVGRNRHGCMIAPTSSRATSKNHASDQK